MGDQVDRTSPEDGQIEGRRFDWPCGAVSYAKWMGGGVEVPGDIYLAHQLCPGTCQTPVSAYMSFSTYTDKQANAAGGLFGATCPQISELGT